MFVVGTSASVGAFSNLKKGLIDYRIAVIFAIPAFVYVYVVRKYLLPMIPFEIVTLKNFVVTRDMGIRVFFAIVMLCSSISMIWKWKLSINNNSSNNYNYPLIIFVGIIIGLLTGIVGIGGRF